MPTAKSQEPAAAPLSAADKVAAQQPAALVKAALQKQQRGEKLTRQELAAWKAWEQEQNQTRGLAFLRAVPQKLYRSWIGGKQTKQLQDHERAYGVPCTGKTIDVPAVIGWLHNFLVERKEELSTSRGDGSLKDQLAAKQIEQLELRIDMLSRKRAIDVGDLAPAWALEAWLAEKAKILRSLTEWFEKQPSLTGREAATQLRTAIADARFDQPYTDAQGRSSIDGRTELETSPFQGSEDQEPAE
jgi:hypothetical protein